MKSKGKKVISPIFEIENSHTQRIRYPLLQTAKGVVVVVVEEVVEEEEEVLLLLFMTLLSGVCRRERKEGV